MLDLTDIKYVDFRDRLCDIKYNFPSPFPETKRLPRFVVDIL